MKNYNGTYLATDDVLNTYNDMVNFQNDNFDEITCAEYDRTLLYIFSAETYEEQIKLYIEQFREGYNSIDYEFTDDVHSVSLNMNTSDIEELVKAISNEVSVEDFQIRSIEECKEYMENSIEEEDY